VANGSKRATRWETDIVSTTMTGATQLDFTLTGNLTEAELRGNTLTRTIGRVYITPQIPGTVSGTIRVGAGIGVIERDAAAANAFPDPLVASDAPGRGWAWRDMLMVRDGESATEMMHPPSSFVFDIRSQRKMYNANLILIMESSLLDGTTFTMRVAFIIRTLWKLP